MRAKTEIKTMNLFYHIYAHYGMGKIAEKYLEKLVIVTEIKKIKYTLLTKGHVRNKMDAIKHYVKKCTQLEP